MKASLGLARLMYRDFNIRRAGVSEDLPSKEILCAVDASELPNRNARRVTRKIQQKSRRSGR